MPNSESIRAVAISGSPSTTSRSRLLLQHAATRLQSEGVGVHVIDLAALPSDDLLARTTSPAIKGALTEVAQSQIVVASTPVYRASYSGLLKVFFDLLPPSALVGKVALAIATGGASGHQLVLDHALRPLFASVGALTTAAGIYAVDAQFDGNGPTAAILERLDRSLLEAVQLARALSSQFSLST